MNHRRIAPLLFLLAACGALGKSGEFSRQVLNGGTGPFRLATQEETGIVRTPNGSLVDSTECIGRAQIVGNAAFYTTATPLAAPPARNPAVPIALVDWAQYQPRRIARTTTHVIDGSGIARQGFAPGTDVLVPTEPFEVNGVSDPAILILPSGTVRLYYATDQGLGIADAPSIDGGFVRVLTTPIFGDVEGRGAASSPAPVLLPTGEIVLYMEAGGAIWAARSNDGISFSLHDGDASTPANDPLALPYPPNGMDAGTSADAGTPAVETSIGGPTAVVATSSIGRTTVRLYFEAWSSDGTSKIGVAGSYDGFAFERSTITCYGKNGPSRPSVTLRSDGITLLTFPVRRNGAGDATSIPVLTSTPAERMLPPP